MKSPHVSPFLRFLSFLPFSPQLCLTFCPYPFLLFAFLSRYVSPFPCLSLFSLLPAFSTLALPSTLILSSFLPSFHLLLSRYVSPVLSLVRSLFCLPLLHLPYLLPLSVPPLCLPSVSFSLATYLLFLSLVRFLFCLPFLYVSRSFRIYFLPFLCFVS